MPAHSESEFSFDLDHIDQVTVRARAFKEFVTDNLDQLDARVQKLVQSGQVRHPLPMQKRTNSG